MQNKILFSAKMQRSGSANVKNGVLQYNKVITNIGGAYNPSDCTFTAPSDGFYMFSWSTTQYSSNGARTITAIVKNGAEQLFESSYVYGGHDVMDAASQTVTMHLATGDRVWIKLESGSNPYVNGVYEGVFTGFKL